MPPPMPEGCPWSGYQQPNVDWCEAELCSWITNPADTWSNLAYLVIALLMWRDARARGSRTLSLFAPASVVVGGFSFAFHASYTFVFQFLDFVGMFVFALLAVAVNLRRAGILSARQLVWFYLGSVTLFSALVPPAYYLGLPFQWLVVFLIAVIVVQEIRMWSTGAHKAFIASMLLLAAGGVCSALDLSRIWCNPHDHWVQGHAAWHLLSAASLYALYLFYSQFDLDAGVSAQAS